MAIFVSVKKNLGIAADDHNFDDSIIMYINSVFMILNQLGVGPGLPFSITGDTEDWSDFFGTTVSLEAVKSYMYVKVRLLFDPPSSSALLESMQKMASELEWRLNSLAEYLAPAT